MGVWPFPILDDIPDVTNASNLDYAIAQIVLDFYTVDTEDIGRQRQDQNKTKYLINRESEMEPTENIP
jgi:hypothetical protein